MSKRFAADPIPASSLLEAVCDGLPFGFVAEVEASGAPIYANARARTLLGNGLGGGDKVVSAAIARLRGARSHIEAVAAADGAAYEISSRIVERDEERIRIILIEDLQPERTLSEGQVAVVDELVHALRGPLTLILGYLELARESPAEGEAFITQSLSAAHAMEGKAATMLSLLTGDVHARGNVVDAHALVEIVDGVCAVFAGGTSEINCNIDPALPPVACSPTELRVIVTTLLGTVIGFGESGASIDIIAAEEPPYVAVRAETIRAYMSGDHRMLTMRSYQRLRKQGVFGSGQGLGLARELILRCGGALSIEGEGDVGLRVTALLPKAEAQA